MVLAAVVLLACAAPPLALARRDERGKAYALIFGTVWGPDNRPVYGVKVRIRKTSDKKTRWQLISDHNGEFAQRVPAGTADYLVSADVKRAGSKPKSDNSLQGTPDRSAVTVHIQNDERIDVGLHLMEQELPRK